MTETERLILENLLAGVEPPTVAAAFGQEIGTVNALADKMIRLTCEIMATGDSPFFECLNLGQARAHRVTVLAILDGLRTWDASERPALQALLRGESGPEVAERYGLTKDAIGDLFARIAPSIAARLDRNEQAALHRNPAAWLRANRARAIEILDRLPSWDHGRQLSHIEFNPIEFA